MSLLLFFLTLLFLFFAYVANRRKDTISTRYTVCVYIRDLYLLFAIVAFLLNVSLIVGDYILAFSKG